MLAWKNFRTLQNFSFKFLLLFGNTYICESAFCTMNLMKHEFRHHIDNLPLEWWIRFEKLVSKNNASHHIYYFNFKYI